MSLQNTAFIGWEDNPDYRLPFDRILTAHPILRDEIGSLLHVEHDCNPELWPFIALASVSYAFNIYKSIGLVILHLYHESGSVLVRQLWEVSLNLHWMERDPENRPRDFGEFTVMEIRKSMQKTGSSTSISEFDDATMRYQQQFRFKDKNNKNQIHSSFAACNVEKRAGEIGDPWMTDYNLLYHLTSMHAHGAPGAVLLQHFTAHSKDPETKEKNSTALVAYISMKIMVANIRLMVRCGILKSSGSVDSIFGDVLKQESES